jgi:2-oxoisovalerate dehydrogenase E2 component (dihydrolipoyl transacylase)
MTIFYLPDLGEGLAEAEIREWYIKEGDEVTQDQPLVSMETAKAVVDVPAPFTGKIIKLYGKAQDVIATGAPLIEFKLPQGQKANHDQGSVVGQLEQSQEKWQETVADSKREQEQRAPAIRALPAARLLAMQKGIDLANITGSGQQGLITVADVTEQLTRSKTEQASSTGTMSDAMQALHGVRRQMAHVMTKAHSEVVPATIMDDVAIPHVAPGTDLTVLVLKAMAHAAAQVPDLNAWFNPKTLARELFQEVNIGLALNAADGLLVPVLKDVANQDTTRLRSMIDHFKQAANNRTINAADFQGATISLSNFGSYGGRYATPVIVPPMVAILGVGRMRDMAVVEHGQVQMSKALPLSLTFDHRVVTGVEAAQFLAAVIQYLTTMGIQ